MVENETKNSKGPIEISGKYVRSSFSKSIDSGLAIKKSEIAQDGADENLEETLFFYPLVGIINAVVRNIYQM